MATVTNYLNATPHSLTLRLVGDGTGVADTPLRAAIIAACDPGPLKEILTRTPDFSVFNLGGPRSNEVHVRGSVCCSLDSSGVNSHAFYFTAAGATVNVLTGQFNLEILLQHSERF